MNPLEWNWTGLLFASVAWWLLAISWWIERARRRRRAPAMGSVTSVTGTKYVVVFEDRINLAAVGAVLLGPPLLLLVVRGLAAG